MSAQKPFNTLLDEIGARTPAPGGGAVTGYSAAIGVALARMVVSYSIGLKKLAEHQPALEEAAQKLDESRRRVLHLADEDARAYGRLNTLMRLPEDDAQRRREAPEAARACTDVPMDVIRACAALMALLEELVPISNRMLRSDLAIAAVLTEAVARAAHWNVRINLPWLAESERGGYEQQASELLASCAERLERVEAGCR